MADSVLGEQYSNFKHIRSFDTWISTCLISASTLLVDDILLSLMAGEEQNLTI